MNFTRLLAASRSVIGLKKKPGPYKMSQDHLLPKFNAERKAGAERSEVLDRKGTPSDPNLAKAEEGAESSSLPGRPVDRAALIGHGQEKAAALAAIATEPSPRQTGRPGKLKRGWGARLSRITPWRSKARVQAPSQEHPVQTELSLETVRVVRNDLSDCDFQVVVAESDLAARKCGVDGNGKDDRAALGMVWNRLTARLLRQAAQEFNLVQKERGKLLSQAGNGSPGIGGS